jgi:hypothetical protein
MYNMHVIYDTTTGIVDKLMPDVGGSLALNVQEGQSSMPWVPTITGIADYSWVEVDGEGNKTLHSAPPKPEHHKWDWATKSWLPNLDAARESQRQSWNACRDRELVAGYPHNGHVFHSDDRFMAELQLILKGYERGYLTGTSAIRTRDNGTLQMTHAEIESLLLLIGLHRQAIYAQSWAGKDALASLTTLEDIMAGGPPA